MKARAISSAFRKRSAGFFSSAFITALDAEATRFVEKREERAAKIAARKNA